MTPRRLMDLIERLASSSAQVEVAIAMNAPAARRVAMKRLEANRAALELGLLGLPGFAEHAASATAETEARRKLGRARYCVESNLGAWRDAAKDFGTDEQASRLVESFVADLERILGALDGVPE